MSITRRRFLAHVAGALAAGCVIPPRGMDAQPAPGQAGIAVLDLGAGCGLTESCLGYRAALAQMSMPFADATPGSFATSRTVIVPGAVEIGTATARTLLGNLHAGGLLLLESAGGFAEPWGFRAHQAMLRDQFGVVVNAPVNLWAGDAASRHVPYVDYQWPHPAKIRDFSRVVPLAREEEGIIGRVDGLPVTLRRRVGRGTLVFLGSPLGPALWAGDREAREWLRQALDGRFPTADFRFFTR